MKFLAILVIALLLPAPAFRAHDFSNPTGFRAGQSEERQVWVNTATGIYHYPGTRWYGNTKQGKFMSEKDAIAQGYRAARNGQWNRQMLDFQTTSLFLGKAIESDEGDVGGCKLNFLNEPVLFKQNEEFSRKAGMRLQ